MIVMDKTIAGATSGEIAAKWRRRIHNLRQKDRRITYTFSLFVILLPAKIGPKSNLFFTY
jgi:hypothetical protein